MRLVAAGAAASLLMGVAGTVGAAAPRARASWHVVEEVFANAGPDPSYFSAITAQTPTSAWAFESTGSKTTPIVAWRLHGASWSKVAFPETYGDLVVAATGTSPSSVYAATTRGALLTWSNDAWRLVAKFAAIVDVHATGAGDLWVAGRRTTSLATRGLWHLDRGTWTRPSSLLYGSELDAVSDTAIFSVTATAVEEFDGHRWHVTSLASLVPPPTPVFCTDPSLTGLIALTPTDLWVTAAGNCQDFSGPFRLLHGVGASWSIAADRQEARGAPFSAGGGSLWIPTEAFACSGCTVMLHLAAGQLTTVPLPLSGHGHGLSLTGGVATARGTTASLAAGWTLACKDSVCDARQMRAVILRYGP